MKTKMNAKLWDCGKAFVDPSDFEISIDRCQEREMRVGGKGFVVHKRYSDQDYHCPMPNTFCFVESKTQGE